MLPLEWQASAIFTCQCVMPSLMSVWALGLHSLPHDCVADIFLSMFEAFNPTGLGRNRIQDSGIKWQKIYKNIQCGFLWLLGILTDRMTAYNKISKQRLQSHTLKTFQRSNKVPSYKGHPSQLWELSQEPRKPVNIKHKN